MLTSDSDVMSCVKYTTELWPKPYMAIMQTNANRYSFFIYLNDYLFLLAATHTGSSLITGLLTAITPERLWGT